MKIRAETPADAAAIAVLVTEAFKGAPHASGTEAAIVAALRSAGALTLSLLSVRGRDIIGHVAFSPVVIGGEAAWFGLGPIAVSPPEQGRGVGSALVREGLRRLRKLGARGVVVLGDPAYYARFGFRPDPGLTLPDVPPEYFQVLPLAGPVPTGGVRYHPAFYPTA